MRYRFYLLLATASLLFFVFIIHEQSSVYIVGSYGTDASLTPIPYRPHLGSHLAIYNLNDAYYEQLCATAELAPYADQLLALRGELGQFESIEQVTLAPGIGLKQYLLIKPYLNIKK